MIGVFYRQIARLTRTVFRPALRFLRMRLARGNQENFAKLSAGLLTGAVLLGFGWLLVLGVSAALSSYAGRVGEVIDWDQKVVDRRFGVEAGKLFQALLVHDDGPLIQFNPRTAELELGMDCTFETHFGNSEDIERRKLFDRLCRSDVGNHILQEVRAWNSSLRILAIRDNRYRERAFCENGERRPSLYVPASCHANGWITVLDLNGRLREVNAVRSGAVPQGLFGFASRDASIGHGDWLNIEPSAVTSGPFRLETEVDWSRNRPSDGILDIEVLGQVAEVWRGNRRLWPGDGAVVEPICDDPIGDVGNCTRLIADDVDETLARGTRIKIELGAGRHALLIYASPIKAIARDVRELGAPPTENRSATVFPKPRSDDDTRFVPDTTYALGNHIRLACIDRQHMINVATGDIEDDSLFVSLRRASVRTTTQRRCQLGWRSVVSRRAGATGDIQIFAENGDKKVPLTCTWQHPDGQSYPTANALAQSLSMVPVVGIDRNDSLSAIGQLLPQVQAGGKLSVDLSIDIAIQAAIARTLEKLNGNGDAFAGVRRLLLPDIDRQRRASLVIIDAGPVFNPGAGDAEMGRILGAAAFPQPRSGLNEWDLRALEQYRATESPLAARMWTQGDRFFAPGSTMKLLVALAGIQAAATDDPQVGAFFGSSADGGLTDARLASLFGGQRYGMSLGSTELIVPLGSDNSASDESGSIRNFARNSLCSSVLGACGPDARLSVRAALARSSNMFFAGMALAIDEDAVSCAAARDLAGIDRVEITRTTGSSCFASGQENALTTRPLYLERAAQRVLPPTDLNLMRAIAGDEAPLRAPLAGSRIFAEPIALGSVRSAELRRFTLAQNGIGQAVQATPLAMAALAGAIGSGRVVHPRLTAKKAPSDRHEPIIPPQADGLNDADIGLAEVLLDEVRAGMKAVVSSPSGTAYDAFSGHKELADRVWGKTGTAQVGSIYAGEMTGNTAWFIGWADDLVNTIEFSGRRLAFACAITGVRTGRQGGLSGGGGTVCGPVVREALLEVKRSLEARQVEMSKSTTTDAPTRESDFCDPEMQRGQI